MNSSELRQTLQQLFNDFANESGKLDIHQTLAILQQNNVKDAELFKLKLTQALKQRYQILTRDQFISYFSQCDNSEHLSAVFDLIDNDKSQHISKKELAEMNRKYNVGLSQNEIKAMINEISSDGQKVSKRELVEFLARK